jgi:Polyketide cyclase / dehydrase and lipid transport
VLRRVAVTREIEVPSPPAAAVAAVQDIKSIELTEKKADHVDVSPGDGRGTYRVRGRFAGLPWKGEFAYQLNDQGFHSVNTDAMSANEVISGGFRVEPTGDGRCVVVHYESYVLPRWLVPLKPLIRAYLGWSMRAELEDLRALILAGGRPGAAAT